MKNKMFRTAAMACAFTGILAAMIFPNTIFAAGGLVQGQPSDIAYSYVVRGHEYHVLTRRAAEHYSRVGKASWYNLQSNFGSQTASGEPFDGNSMTAASKVLPLGATVRVFDLKTHKSVIVKINDRGPFVKGRIIDLAYKAATQLGTTKEGVAHVRVTVLSV